MSKWALSAWCFASALVFVMIGGPFAVGVATVMTLSGVVVLVTGAELHKKDKP